LARFREVIQRVLEFNSDPILIVPGQIRKTLKDSLFLTKCLCAGRRKLEEIWIIFIFFVAGEFYGPVYLDIRLWISCKGYTLEV